YGCRRIDLAELKRLIEPRMPKGTQLFVDWDQAAARLRAAGVAMGLLDREAPREAMPSEEPAPPGAAITKETILANLPQRMTAGFAFIGIQGLNAEVEAAEQVLPGHPILRLVAVPTTGRHYFAAQSTTLHKNQVYRIAAWVKATAGMKVEMQVSDDLSPRDGKARNYGSAIFDLAAETVSSSSGRLKDRGIEQRPGGWQKIWVDLETVGGELVLAFGLVSKDRSEFKGDGRLAVAFGGIEVAE